MRFRIKNQPQLETWLNALAQEIERVEKGRPRLNAGVNVLIDESADGFTITGTGTGGSESLSTAPFQLDGIIETEPSNAFVTVSPGLVNNRIPKIGGVSITHDPAPRLDVSGAAGVVWLKCPLDSEGEIIDPVEVKYGEELPDDSETFVYRLIGTFTSEGGEFTSLVSLLNTNQAHMLCGGVSRWGRA